jgi:hypothetical protein
MKKWISSYAKRGLIGVVLAFLSTLLFGATRFGVFLTLLAISFSGFLGTTFSLLTPLGEALRAPLIDLGLVKLPIIFVWFVLDALHLLLKIPRLEGIVRKLSGLIGILTAGIGFALVEVVRVCPLILKVMVFLLFGFPAF